MLFEKEDEGRVQEFIAELRSMNLTVEGMVEDYDRLIALYDISFFFRIYLRSCAQSLRDRVFDQSQSSLSAGYYIQFFETELTTMPRMVYLFQRAYGSRFVRSVYQASYLTFIERQQQATNFLKKCVAEHDKFTFFRKTIATIEDNQLIEEPKVLNPRIKGKPHNRPISQVALGRTEDETADRASKNRVSKDETSKDQTSDSKRLAGKAPKRLGDRSGYKRDTTSATAGLKPFGERPARLSSGFSESILDDPDSEEDEDLDNDWNGSEHFPL
ncbi:hypothetical protein P0082_08685 [Candidatus Haliotispira prima]|uniref:Uncharacterized protein n=1 Tax=Candidatus Haliotispira prima TaxID=3034016 RepID=A0ABY8MF77_9SPIO|nr:hypothetical protein P0082_08685 [Candidatus Haliotispira prima]